MPGAGPPGRSAGKSWGGCLGRAIPRRCIIPLVTGRAAVMQLSIDVGSDPISGSLSVDTAAPQQFSGWIELVAAIESLRHTASLGAQESRGAQERLGAQESLGAQPVANGRAT